MTSSQAQRVIRKPGRGFRPYLLIPKVLAMAVYFGAMVCAAVLWHVQIGCKPMEEIDAATLMQQLMTIRLLVVCVGVPALLLTIVMGLLLWLEHPKTFLRMRWVRVKLILLGLGIPGFHVFMASRLYHFRHTLESGTIEQSLKNQLTLGFTLLLIWSAVIIWLGRHKPRLWQNWAKNYKSKTK
ncbi:MAG TPA: hypothetical protein DCM28_22040 [Phycisphaerales bacterium]|nr:hypothetical protein [Phycisphaerales bacterium]|tara:strand:- start:73 stop:621 length:549 start_codon:yes stop_codon:yes gene_type:complete